jgi:hypothetical protein
MVVEFKTVEAIDSLVALLRVADASAVHCWEQDEPFHPGVFPGLILLARFASQRAGEEHAKAMAAAAQIRNLEAERNAARELHLVKVRQYNAEVERRLALEKQLAQVTAERDSLQRQWDDLEKSFVQSMQPKMASVVQLVEAAKATAVEVTKKLGELPDEPAPEPYPWQVGDEIECPGVTRRKVVGTCRPWVSLEGIQEACPQPEWERRGWKLYRKASDVPPEPFPEPYPWQVGDEVKRDDGTIHTISQAIGGLLWFKDQTIGVSAQWWLSENGCTLHRKASDMPDLPPLTPQQVAEFAAVAEPGWEVGDRVLSANTGLVWTVDSKSAGSVTLRHIAMPIHATIDELKGAGFTLTDKNHPCKCAVGCSQPRNPISGSVGTDGEGQP